VLELAMRAGWDVEVWSAGAPLNVRFVALQEQTNRE
jgi:hypothetical protein